MPKELRTITREDILSLTEYDAQRAELKKNLISVKKRRRAALGPHAMFYFESWETMWMQIHEMLRIEKGGEEQIKDELAAYNPLVPKGKELTATVMFEIDDELARNRILRQLTHVEERMFIQIGDERAYAEPEQEVERTAEDGKTSSVHFLHFRLSDPQIEAFREPSVQVLIGCDHENYGHLAVLGEETREELLEDI